ncbi:MAG: putative O-glycosylation ligase, exosortase A system-associated [Sphingomonadales bacterium]|nr:putative O-glycosylation ligase, exosortase A system-associated [Sphingomonadales bacterium]MBD3774484.1 putative O-glycosylation ligase, exosortase A system-associated [Paracoccaceae bacterium]
MLDLALLCFVLGFLALGLRRPFVWVLAYLYIDILAPQKIGWSLTAAVPVSLIAFCAAFGGWLLADSKDGSRVTFRQGLLLALLLYCGWTTMNADFPEFAQEKWSWVWKALVFAMFLPLTLRTRLRFESALLVMVLTAGSIIINAGLKTFGGGGGYGSLYLYVNDNSGIYESSTLATVAVAIIPLVLWLARFGTIFPPDWRVRLFAGALIFACLLIPIGTEARTGLLCIAVLGLLLLRDAKRRMAYLAAGLALVIVAVPFLPQSYYDRMATIGEHSEDESASTRVAVWQWTLDYVAAHPTGGGFDAYRANKFTYKMPVVVKQGNTTAIEYQDVTDHARAYHSAIFEMLGEQGWPGLFLWLWIHALGLWQMERIRRRWRKRTAPGEAWQAPLASALQLAQIVYLIGSLFQGIAYQPFVLMLVGLQCALWSYCRRLDSPGKKPVGMRGDDQIAQPLPDAVAAGSPALR